MEVKPISPERVALLKACGFAAPPDGEDTDALRYRSLALDTRMLVTGDHATDYAYIHYAETDELCGFFYAPSLLEYLLNFHGDKVNEKVLVRELSRYSDCKISLVSVCGYPMIFTPIYENDTTVHDLMYQISDMLKVVGQLDYILPRKRDRIWRAQEKANAQAKTEAAYMTKTNCEDKA